MARYALTHDEINDYVSYSNSNLGVIGSDVSFGMFLKIPSNTGAGFKYFLSNGNFGDEFRLNAFIYEGSYSTTSLRNRLRLVTFGGATDTPVSFDWTTEKCVIFERVSNIWYVWVGDTGGTMTRYTLHTDSGNIATSGWETGRRADGNVDRYFGGDYSRLFWADRGLTQTEADNIANGDNPATVLGASIVANYLYDEGTGSTVNDSESAATGTLNNFPGDDSQWSLIPGGGTDSLLADDLSSNSEVSSPAVGQTHTLTATSISSSTDLSSPAIGQSHAFTSDSIQAATEISQPSLSTGGTDNLLADDINSASSVSTPAIGQTHVLSANGLESAAALSNPNVGQIHVILANDIQSASVLSSPLLNRPVSDPPTFRTVTIAAESRKLLISVESRKETISSESRKVTL